MPIRARDGKDSVESQYWWVERTVGALGVMCGLCEEAAKFSRLGCWVQFICGRE